MRKIPPVGTPLRLNELAAVLRPSADAGRKLADDLRERIPSQEAYLFGSGRAALAALLKALHRLYGKQRVIVPAYTCWSVPAAIVRAGLRVLPVDVQPGSIDYDLDRLARLDWDDVLAVISPNLFGLPGDLTRLQGLAEAHKAALIDDAAQALGASLRGTAVGGFGQAGIVSFGRGKNITALGGGAALVRDDDLNQALSEIADSFRGEPAPNILQTAAKGAAMRVALWPTLYPLAESLPWVDVGKTEYEPNFATAAFGDGRAALALQVLARLETINQQRGRLAELMDRALLEQGGLVLPRPRSGAVPAWLRRPVLAPEPAKRDELLSAWQSAGIGASAMYPAPVHKIPGLEGDLDMRGAPFAGAERLAASIIVLPLVQGANDEDFQAVKKAAANVLGKRRMNRWV